MKIKLPQVTQNDVNMRFSTRVGAMPETTRRNAIPKSTRAESVALRTSAG